MSKPIMMSNRPYLLRAFYDWIVDSHCTPHIYVDASLPGVNVPEQYVENGRMVLNISAQAVSSLTLGNEWVTFHARFGGKLTYIEVPTHAVNAIYARENGEGVTFKTELSKEEFPQDVLIEQSAIKRPNISKVPALKVVK